MLNYEYRQLTYGRGYVYSIQYHIVWCVKYRRKILVKEIEDFVKNEISQILNDEGIEIIALECNLDHIHILISCSPQHYIPTIVKILKGNTARHLFMKFPEIRSELYDGHLWNPSYFVSTVNENTTSQIKEYINSQKEK